MNFAGGSLRCFRGPLTSSEQTSAERVRTILGLRRPQCAKSQIQIRACPSLSENPIGMSLLEPTQNVDYA
jgi:hypothetical protein